MPEMIENPIKIDSIMVHDDAYIQEKHMHLDSIEAQEA